MGLTVNPWQTVTDAALMVARPAHSVRTWIRRGKVPTLRDCDTGQILVHLPSLGEYARHAERRWSDPRHAHRRRRRVA